MDDDFDTPLINYGRLRRDIAEAIRAAIRERADELGITYAACIDLLLKQDSSPEGMQRNPR